MRQRQDQAECSSDRSVERTQRPRDWQNPSTLSCALLTSQANGCGRSQKRCRTPMAWWSKVSPTWIGSFDLYQRGDKNVYAVFSKERARDGYMRYPAVLWSRRKRGFVCPDCLELIEMETSSDGTRYMVPSDQFFSSRRSIWRTTYVLIAAHRFGRRSMTGVKCRG